MEPRVAAWALVLLSPALVLALPAHGPEAAEKLCGHHFMRELVRVCGGPRWSPEAGKPAAGGDRELLQWLEGGHVLGLVADGDHTFLPARQPWPRVPHHRRRRGAPSNPAHRCCLSGCTQQDLKILCPH